LHIKTTTILVYLLIALTASATAQQVNGLIYADTAGVMVVKVWGNHQKRGYALGYLTGDRITDVMANYVKPSFGAYYSLARNTIIEGNDLYKGENQVSLPFTNNKAGIYLIKLSTQGGETVGKIMIVPF